MKTIKTLIENRETYGRNSVDREIRTSGGRVWLLVTHTEQNGQRKEQSYYFDYEPNWKNSEFLWQLTKLLNELYQ